MKSIGITRKVDDLGRVVLPKELRRTFDLDRNASIEIFTEGDQIILKKYNPACVFCGEGRNTVEFMSKRICTHCLQKMKKI